MHRYLYAFDNPTAWYDPTGREGEVAEAIDKAKDKAEQAKKNILEATSEKTVPLTAVGAAAAGLAVDALRVAKVATTEEGMDQPPGRSRMD